MNENIDLTKILKENPIGVKVGKLTILREVEKSKHPNGRGLLQIFGGLNYD